MLVFLCKQKTAYELRISDWSSDVCSSDLSEGEACGHTRPMGTSVRRQRAAVGRADPEIAAGVVEARLDLGSIFRDQRAGQHEGRAAAAREGRTHRDRKSTRLNSSH